MSRISWGQPLLFVGLLCMARVSPPSLARGLATPFPLGDRLIMYINFKAFTQRQVEIYLGMREALLDKPASFRGPEAATWQSGLEIFQEAMVIAAEASKKQTTSLMPPSDAEIQAAETHLHAYKAASLEFRNFCDRLSLAPEEYRAAISEILVIARFRERKEFDATWVAEARKRNQIHYFDGSTTYEPIVPLAERAEGSSHPGTSR